jgi:hypothetical protein
VSSDRISEASVADLVRPWNRPAPRRSSDFGASRLRRSWVLRGCAALAFLEYGALAVVAMFGRALRPDLFKDGLNFSLAGWLALCSLASWSFLFAWFPFLRTLHARDTGDGSALAMGRVLETFAISCVAVVHVMLALILGTAL